MWVIGSLGNKAVNTGSGVVLEARGTDDGPNSSFDVVASSLNSTRREIILQHVSLKRAWQFIRECVVADSLLYMDADNFMRVQDKADGKSKRTGGAVVFSPEDDRL